MWKSGICSLREIRQKTTFWGRLRPISLHILREIDASSPEQVAVFEEVVRDLRLSSGIYRTTTRGRFAWLDEAVAALIRESFSGTDLIKVEDWATSDGLAAMEWAQAMSALNLHVEMTASDLFLSLVACALPDGRLWIVEPDGRPLQFVQPPFVVSLKEKEPAAYPLNRLLASRAMQNADEIQRSLVDVAWRSPLDETEHERGEWRFSQIPLVHPEVRQFCRGHAWFTTALHDAFKARRPEAHVIRSMNILNRSYFDNEKLRRGVLAVRDSLCEGGLWIVGNTGDLANPLQSASVFERRGHGFARLRKIGVGSEIDELAADISERR